MRLVTLAITTFLSLVSALYAQVPGAPAYAYPDPHPMTAPAGQHNAGASWTHVMGGCTNSLLIVEVAIFGNIAGVTVTVTYNGGNVPLYKTGSLWTKIFVLQSPSPGSHSVSVTMSGTYYWQAGAVGFCNADPVRPLDAYGSRGVGYQLATSRPTNVSSWASTVPSAPGSWMFDAYYLGNSSASIACSPCSNSKIVNDAADGQAFLMSLTQPKSAATSSNTWTISTPTIYEGIALTVNPPQRAFPRVLNWLGSTALPSGGTSGWSYKDGNYLHLTTPGGCYDIMDIANPMAAPVAVTSMCDSTGHMADGGFVVVGDYAYEGAKTTNSFNVIQVRDTTTHTILVPPVLVASLQDATNLLSVEGTFKPANVPNVIMTMNVNGGFITTVDVTDPTHPAVIAKYSGLGGWDLAYDGVNTLYVAPGGNLQVVDVSTAVPTLVTNFTPACQLGYGPSLVGNYLYGTCNNSGYGPRYGITVIDVSDRAHPRTVNTITLTSPQGAITAADGTPMPGGYAATTGARCLYSGNNLMTQYAWAFDIHTDPTTPKLVDSIYVANVPDDFKVYNGILYISDDPVPAYYLMCR